MGRRERDEQQARETAAAKGRDYDRDMNWRGGPIATPGDAKMRARGSGENPRDDQR